MVRYLGLIFVVLTAVAGCATTESPSAGKKADCETAGVYLPPASVAPRCGRF